MGKKISISILYTFQHQPMKKITHQTIIQIAFWIKEVYFEQHKNAERTEVVLFSLKRIRASRRKI